MGNRNSLSEVPIVDNPVLVVHPVQVSDLYAACRSNRVEDVNQMLETASLADINRLEPLGSTALHAAAYYGHTEIVKILLEKGAIRTIRNKHGFVPYEEVSKLEIKKLFERLPNTQRFGGFSGSVEWNVIDLVTSRSVSKYKATEEQWYKDQCADDNVKYFGEIQRYIRKKLAHINGIDQILFFVDKAIKENNVEYILTAYTAQTGFCGALNIELASINGVIFQQNDDEALDEYFRYWHGPGGYAALIACHPVFSKYAFIGKSYRGMGLLEEEINIYKAKTFIINKAFLSTSTDRSIAKDFARRAPLRLDFGGNILKYPAICTYRIRNKGTAFQISSFSEYPLEEEVLITPRVAFQVESIKKRASSSNRIMVYIELRECTREDDYGTSSTDNPDDPYY